MSAIKITIHSTGSGCCSLTNKETDGLSVTFEDGTVLIEKPFTRDSVLTRIAEVLKS